jgi:hypothetical protein
MSFSESLEGSTSLLKKSTVLSMYSLSPDLSYVPESFYDTLQKSFKTKSPEHDVLIKTIFSHWSKSRSNVNAAQSGYIVFVSKNSPVFVLENSYLSRSSHSYCEVINLDTVVMDESPASLYWVLLLVLCMCILSFIIVVR